MGARDVTVVDATSAHAAALVHSMRPADVEELRVSEGSPTPAQALEDGLLLSDAAFTILFGEEVGAMFGVCPVFIGASPPPGTGAVWCLTGTAVDENPNGFLKATIQWLPFLLEFYPVLINHIDARHETALRWAKWAGFTILPAEPHGPFGLPFHTVVLRRS